MIRRMIASTAKATVLAAFALGGALSQPSAAESIDQPEIQDQAKLQAELQKAEEAMAAKREKFQAENMRRIFELIRPSALSLGH